MLSLLSTGHPTTAHTKIKQQLLLQLPLKKHIDLVLVEFPMVDLAYVREDHEHSSKDRFNQGNSVLIAEIKVPVPAVNIASYSLRPGILILTSTIP